MVVRSWETEVFGICIIKIYIYIYIYINRYPLPLCWYMYIHINICWKELHGWKLISRCMLRIHVRHFFWATRALHTPVHCQILVTGIKETKHATTIRAWFPEIAKQLTGGEPSQDFGLTARPWRTDGWKTISYLLGWYFLRGYVSLKPIYIYL